MAKEYQVIDKQTQQVISTHKTRQSATRKADRLDNQYGAIRYIVKPIWDDENN